jgi:hypothetical protein
LNCFIFLALDDIFSKDDVCPATKTCDFEADLCDFTNDITFPLKWQISGPNSIIGDSSYPDHTSMTGSFAYFLLSLGNVNDKAQLISQKYKPSGTECLQFWYYSNNDNINGTLNILKLSENVYSSPLWSKKEFNTDGWQYGQVEIGDSRNEFSIIFEGVKNVDNSILNAFIGIDDVILKIGSCLPPIICNFEDATICSWSQFKYDDLDWLVSQGRKGSKLFKLFFLIYCYS